MPETQTTMLAKVTSALPIAVRVIVTFLFQQLIFASGVSPLVTFPPQLDFPGPGSDGTGRTYDCQLST